MALTYKEAVAKGRRLIRQEGNIKWQLGDLALQVVPVSGKGLRDGDEYVDLRKFADSLGVSEATLDRYRSVAAAFKEEDRDESIAFGLYDTLQSQPDRRRILKKLIANGTTTVDDARREIGKRPTRFPPVSDAPVSETAALVREALRDPKVAQEVIRDRDTFAGLGRAQGAVVAQRRADAEAKGLTHHERNAGYGELLDSTDQQLAPMKAAKIGRDFIALIAGKKLNKDTKELLIEEIDNAIATWMAARDAVENPLAASVEEFLSQH